MDDVPIVVGGSSSLEFKNSELGADLEYISTTRGAMAEQMTALDSARQIGPSTLLKDDLMVVGGSSSMVQKKAQNRRRYRGFLNNQRSYWKTDCGI